MVIPETCRVSTKGVGMTMVIFGPISETVYIDILNTIIEKLECLPSSCLLL
jgi:hypothetical protein